MTTIATHAEHIADLCKSTGRQYGVFVSRSVQIIPTDGVQYQRLMTSPLRAAHHVGTFDPGTPLSSIVDALAEAGVE